MTTTPSLRITVGVGGDGRVVILTLLREDGVVLRRELASENAVEIATRLLVEARALINHYHQGVDINSAEKLFP